MRKKLTSNDLQRGISRSLLAASLIAALAVFGCSTNRNPGNGEPYTGGPSWGPTTPSSTSTPGGGSSSGTSGVPPSMTSSSTLSTNDAALAILAEHQRQPRILGPAAPETGARISNQPTGQWNNPALALNPQATVNSSVSSGPTTVISSGAGEGVGGTTAPSASANTLTPAAASSTVVPGAFAAGPTIAATSVTPATTPTTAATTTNTGTLTPTVSSGAVSSTTVATSPLIVIRNANGSLTITNVHP